MNFDTTTVQPRLSPTPPTPDPRRRRPVTGWVVAIAVALAAPAGWIIGISGAGPSGGPSADQGRSTDVSIPQSAGALRSEHGGVALGQSPSDSGKAIDQKGNQPQVLDQTGDQPQVLDQSGDQPQVLDQTGDQVDVDPPGPQPLPATLSITPDQIQLKMGVYAGSFTIANVGDEPMTWTAIANDTFVLSDTGGVTGAHDTNVVSFTIDESKVPFGVFHLSITVDSDGGTTDVGIHGQKPMVIILP